MLPGLPSEVMLSSLDLPDFAGVPVPVSELKPVRTIDGLSAPEHRWEDPMGRLWGRRASADGHHGRWRELTPRRTLPGRQLPGGAPGVAERENLHPAGVLLSLQPVQECC